MCRIPLVWGNAMGRAQASAVELNTLANSAGNSAAS